MAYVKITDLTEISSGQIEDDDVVLVDDISIPESRKLTVASLRDKILSDQEEENYFFTLLNS